MDLTVDFTRIHSKLTLRAGGSAIDRLRSLKLDNGYLWPPKGLMIEDKETVARITVLADQLGLSKRAVAKMMLELELTRLDAAI